MNVHEPIQIWRIGVFFFLFLFLFPWLAVTMARVAFSHRESLVYLCDVISVALVLIFFSVKVITLP